MAMHADANAACTDLKRCHTRDRAEGETRDFRLMMQEGGRDLISSDDGLVARGHGEARAIHHCSK